MTHQGKWTELVVLTGAVWAVCAGYAVVTYAAPQKPPPAGVSSSFHLYTEAQAMRGKTAVGKSCVSCHHEDLNSGEGNVDLSNDHFLAHWGVVSLGYMANYIQTAMPESAAGTLTLQQSTDIVAYVLWLNYYPIGEQELPADLVQLSRITLQTQADHFHLVVQ